MATMTTAAKRDWPARKFADRVEEISNKNSTPINIFSYA
jgi:hypothetical protein